MIARASSGSKSCSSSVEPLMSANSAVTVLRSPSSFSVSGAWVTRTDDASAGWVVAFGLAPARGAAHSLQNLAPGLEVAPQRGHFAAIGEAHSLQNFAPSGFSAEHFRQSIGRPWYITQPREGTSRLREND